MKHFYFLFLFFALSLQSLTAQSSREQLTEDLKEYHSIPREVAYLHLNKNVLLKGEALGFSAYVVNKNDLKPSTATTNLYVEVKNQRGEVIKQKVLLVEDGVTSNIFEIDSTFASGDYQITAFTNWMRNFEEQNYFTGSFKILGSNLDYNNSEERQPEIDAQFLPESGHLLSGVVNNIGIVVKDHRGYGLPNAKVLIKNSQNRDLGDVNLNQFGIGKFSIIPNWREKYSAVVQYDGKEFPVTIDTPVEREGIILSANQRGSELRMLVTTNAASFSKMQNEPLYLTVQNRKMADAYEIKFRNQESIPVLFDLSTLASGINIITLFDEAYRPIAERLIFNHENLPLEEMQEAQITSLQDSLKVNLYFQDMKKGNISVSILPKNTISLVSNYSIVSYNLLQPYVRGSIENGGWYFRELSEEKKYALDNLLLTQGWSSYDWKSIFSSKLALAHNFEKNFEVKAIINRKDTDNNNLRYLVHSTANNEPLFVEIPSEKEAFIFDEFRPVEGEPIYISRIKNNDKLVPAGLVLQSFPLKVPDFYTNAVVLPQKPQDLKIAGNRLKQVTAFGADIEELGEVLLVAKKVDDIKQRERKLGAHSYGTVDVLQLEDVNLYGTLANYLRAKGFRVDESGGGFSASTMMGSTGSLGRGSAGSEEPMPELKLGASQDLAFYLDGVLLYDLSSLHQYPLITVDYIEINKTGMGNGFIGNAGHVKIYSDFTSSKVPNLHRNRVQEFKLPLAYSEKKLFYIPRYENTFDEFFQEFGVIAWEPELVVENGEEVDFTFKKPEVDFQMIIEGFTAAGNFIYSIETVSVEK